MASFLNTEGYTPAYTLKSKTIQMLSFLTIETYEQDHGGVVNLSSYKRFPCNKSGENDYRNFRCGYCGFDGLGMRPGRNAKALAKAATATLQTNVCHEFS